MAGQPPPSALAMTAEPPHSSRAGSVYQWARGCASWARENPEEIGRMVNWAKGVLKTATEGGAASGVSEALRIEAQQILALEHVR